MGVDQIRPAVPHKGLHAGSHRKPDSWNPPCGQAVHFGKIELGRRNLQEPTAEWLLKIRGRHDHTVAALDQPF